MSNTEYWFRRIVIALARHVPVESPGWATMGIFFPNLMSFVVVRGALVAAHEVMFVSAFFTTKTLFWMEVGVQCFMAFVGLSFLARLLQICDRSYFDPYKLDETR